MQGLLLRWLVLAAAIVIAAYLLPGIHIASFWSALFAALVLGFLNAFFRPILFILTLPINVFTIGLFTFVINAFLLQMTSGVIDGFVVKGFWSALFGSVIISIISGLLSSSINNKGRVESIDVELHRRRGDHWE